MKKMKVGTSILVIMMFLLSACSAAVSAGAGTGSGSIEASGTISAVEINIASELSGKVIEMAVKEGDKVSEGDVLFRLDEKLLLAQYNQADTAVKSAAAAVESAKLQLDSAQLQANLAHQAARTQTRQLRLAEGQAEQPAEFKQPDWYFDKKEKIASALAAVQTAQNTLDGRKADLQEELSNASNQDFITAEKRLGAAQAVFQAAQETLDQIDLIKENKDFLVAEAEKALDAARAELEASQLDYDRILTKTSVENVLEARARVATAQIMLDNSQDAYDVLKTGEDSLGVETADMSVKQAASMVTQAEAGFAQAQAALDLLDLQLKKAAVTAPVSGIVLSVNLDKGEMVAAGSLVMVIGQLEEVTITVYIPEDQYGRISLGQTASVMVDSFPNRTFNGTVRYIADQAEFTPRNVQTTAGRKTTVYAVKISLENTDQSLKPGMNADVILD